MVAFVRHDDTPHFIASPAGAESNVAIGMARLGCRARWVSRLGDDPLGRLITATVSAAGVDVAVEVDPRRQTGILVKHITTAGSRVDYYRSESAARALEPRDLGRGGHSRIWHVTGITPALSESAARLSQAIVGREGPVTGLVTFDVNFRPSLWPDAATAARTLLPLARQADVVFIGDDEAEALLNTSDPEQIASLVLQRDDQELILKRGREGASLITRQETVFEPAFSVDVVDVTGAGDAFAAGYLAGVCWEWPASARLQLGHLLASRVVGSIEDVPPAFEADEIATLTPEHLRRFHT